MTINEQILEVLKKYTEGYLDDAAKELSALLLQSQVDLLTKYRDEFMNRFLSSILDKEIENLTQQIDNLSK